MPNIIKKSNFPGEDEIDLYLYLLAIISLQTTIRENEPKTEISIPSRIAWATNNIQNPVAQKAMIEGFTLLVKSNYSTNQIYKKADFDAGCFPCLSGWYFCYLNEKDYQ
jgi:hypothetical protein